MVKARSQFKERSSATNVEILLPLPPDAITPNVRTSQVSLAAVPFKGAQHARFLSKHPEQIVNEAACQMLYCLLA